MNCCIGSQARPASKPFSANAASGPVEHVPRASFEAGGSHVGTDRPELPQDGEGPRRAVKLQAFELEVTTVTNARFSAFVDATGYVTDAERYGWSPVFINLLPDSAIHSPVGDQIPWWVRVDGACWHAPEGPLSSVVERGNHPVGQVSWNDAQAFAAWSGGRLPTEAEWEHAARGGLADPRFPWGDEEPDDSTIHCNIWQGRFPSYNSALDGFTGASPVDAFAPNGAGLFGMAGNVWEWTADPFKVRSVGKLARQRNEQAAKTRDKVIKGGSFLCHRSYCYRYRIAARSAMSAESSTSNTGFRLCYATSPQR